MSVERLRNPGLPQGTFGRARKRLTRPLVRKGGQLAPAGWEEALDRAAAGFLRIRERYGSEGIGVFSSSRATNELNYLAGKFARQVLGTNNVDSCNRTCHAASVVGLRTVFGAGGSTSSYREMEETDLILLWGGNPREAHPIVFHHVLKGVRNGARLIVVDPRRSASSAFAHRWLPVRVGTDIALANAMGRYLIHEGLIHQDFIREATEGFERYREAVEPYTLERAEAITGVAAEEIARTAREYATAPRAMILWTLGITEHHNGADNVFALIDLALLTGHVGRYGSGLNPLRGQNNVQGGGDMGALPDRLVGFQPVEDPEVRARFEEAWNCRIPPRAGLHQSAMFEAMEEGRLRGLYVIGENPVQSEANSGRIRRIFEGLEFLVVQDIFLTATGELADVVLPSAAGWCETEGTVTNSERRVQRVRKALEPPGEAKDDIWILQQLARRMGYPWAYPDAEAVWNEVRELSPMHRGMSYRRLEELGGIQWPCPEEGHPGEVFLHGRLWQWPLEGPRVPFVPVEYRPPAEEPDDEYPLQLTTGRYLYFYNTGVQSQHYVPPVPMEECIVLNPADAARFGLVDGSRARVSSRRGTVEATVRVESTVSPGLCFMTFHFPEQTATNLITSDAWDPKSGTAEFKAAAVRVEPVAPACTANGRGEVGEGSTSLVATHR